jgi:hypothetical protein
MTELSGSSSYPGWLTRLASFLSWLFHPLFLGVYMMFYIVFLHPDLFLAVPERVRVFRFITFVVNNLFFPLLIVMLMRWLGFSGSLQMRTPRERIVPYIASITFFFWTWHVFRNQSDSPEVLVDMCQGMFFASSLAIVLNNFSLVSMHAIGLGGLLGLMYGIIDRGLAESALPMILSILLTGLVCTSRLILSRHTLAEIVLGLLTGLGTQLLAYAL